eukprot:TRINITY_DN361_c0_g1_i1.p1 TRINITY_DN361_c0_g1~~TRINITY_DN361_c0_g1_i1.p1  ORF type:complete len:264 (+),score=46.36 TRINITY_DN361_c0_g1_i1:388-1179(+)
MSASAFRAMFSGPLACVLDKFSLPSATNVFPNSTSLTISRYNPIKLSAVPDGYAVTGSSKNLENNRPSKVSANNADQRSNDMVNFKSPVFLLSRFFKEDQAVIQKAEETLERSIFNFRFLALLAVMGSLAGSLLCFLNGCVYVVDSFRIYWTNCLRGIHTGQMVLRLVEAVDMYLAGTVMLIFGLGLYGLFIRDLHGDEPSDNDNSIVNSSFFGMFTLKHQRRVQKCLSNVMQLASELIERHKLMPQHNIEIYEKTAKKCPLI